MGRRDRRRGNGVRAFDPLRAAVEVFFLPDRNRRFQRIHQPAAGLERLRPVRRGHGDGDAALADGGPCLGGARIAHVTPQRSRASSAIAANCFWASGRYVSYSRCVTARPRVLPRTVPENVTSAPASESCSSGAQAVRVRQRLVGKKNRRHVGLLSSAHRRQKGDLVPIAQHGPRLRELRVHRNPPRRQPRRERRKPRAKRLGAIGDRRARREGPETMSRPRRRLCSWRRGGW